MNSELDDLRKQIDKCDEELIELLQRRFAITAKVGQLKAASNVGSVDPDRENQQFIRIEKLARESNISPILARTLLRNIIDRVVIDHELLKSNQQSSVSAVDRPSVGVIGMGDFGKLTTKHLKDVCSVKCFDKNNPDGTHLKDIMKCDYIIVAVPLSALPGLLQQIRPILKPSTVLIDVCSVKQKPMEIYKQILPKHKNLVFTHPMFGPQSAGSGLVGHTIIFCNQNTASKNIQKFCRDRLGLKVVSMSAPEHDVVMANMHALTFFVARGLNNLGLKPSRFQAPSFKILLDLVELDKAQSQELFETVECGNPAASLVRSHFIDELQKLDARLR